MQNSEKVRFFAMLPSDMDQCAAQWNWPRYRTRQIYHWVFQKYVTDPWEMLNLSKDLRQTVAERISFDLGKIAQDKLSADGTRKLLITWPDNNAMAESVLIPDASRRTACISSQVGCPVGCRFCASGLNGTKGNLSADQIVQQILILNSLLAAAKERITNVVFMGMGEPLANYANVIKAVRILHDPQCFNIGARKITISTVGVPPKMRQLAEEELPLNLAISLHAPNESLRKQLIPWAEHFALEDILEAARHYFQRTGREVTLEYILLHDLNDRPEHARQLTAICRTLRANVNLIRYNEVEGLPFHRPNSEAVIRFQSILREGGINAHVRKSRGRDIDAACGQLRRSELASNH